MANVHSMFGKGRGRGVGCSQSPFVFLEVVHQSPSRLAYISGGAFTTRDQVHHSALSSGGTGSFTRVKRFLCGWKQVLMPSNVGMTAQSRSQSTFSGTSLLA